MTWKLVPGPIVFTENYHNLHWKMIFLKQSDSIGYVMVKLLKYVTCCRKKDHPILRFQLRFDVLNLV